MSPPKKRTESEGDLAHHGYVHAGYADSLREFGTPFDLAASGARLLRRPIANTGHADAMGCYPLFFCERWSSLPADLESLSGLVSVVTVTEPFAPVTLGELERSFPDRVSKFKEHLVVDLREASPSRHHREQIRRALKVVSVESSEAPEAYLEEWERLYAHLRLRKHLTGIQAFSRSSFQNQLAVPGCVAFRAIAGGQCVAMNLWFVVGEVAYYHLAASNADGYRFSASYALLQAAIDAFTSRGLRWMSLGAGAGNEPSEDGLFQFKRGWATGARPVFLCGRILDRPVYQRLTAESANPGSSFFPAYRAGAGP